MAEKDGVSLNTFIVSAISMKVGAQDLFNRLLNELKSRLLQPTRFVMPLEYQLNPSEITPLSDVAFTKQTGLAKAINT